MSRHRNVRNLTEDDYYDEYDDYDDYDDGDHYESNYDSYKAPPKKPIVLPVTSKKVQDKLAPNKKQSNIPKATPFHAPEESIKMMVLMGFTRSSSIATLRACNNDVEAAIDKLLQGGKGPGGKSEAKLKILSPIKSSDTPRKPTSSSLLQALESTKVIKSEDTKLSNGKCLINTTEEKNDVSPLPKIPEDLAAEIATQKSRLSMVVIGHVDAGKSTLLGQIMVQLGQVAKRTIQKYQRQALDIGKASFALAWVMDEDDTERERGVTIDVATKCLSSDVHDFVLLDAPGHSDFVPAMITGAAAADVGIIVIAATTGEFEAGFDGGGQTREHIILARGLGVSQLIVAINKLDAMDWKKERFDEIQRLVEPFLLKCGFVSKRVQYIPVSGLTGVNVKSRTGEKKLCEWYNGPTLLEAMDSFQPATRLLNKPLRIIVNDVFTEGKGVSVRCRVVQGVLQVGEKIIVLPIGDEAQVSRIDHNVISSENRCKYAIAGDTTDVLLTGIDSARLTTGNVICHSQHDLRPPLKRKVRARIMIMDQISTPIIMGAQVLIHMHSIDVPTTISKLISSIDPKKKNSQREKPRFLTAGMNAMVELSFTEKIAIEVFSDCRSLGRFVARRCGETVALGIVEELLG
jgi:elongation factor 1 alpha-like protein